MGTKVLESTKDLWKKIKDSLKDTNPEIKKTLLERGYEVKTSCVQLLPTIPGSEFPSVSYPEFICGYELFTKEGGIVFLGISSSLTTYPIGSEKISLTTLCTWEGCGYRETISARPEAGMFLNYVGNKKFLEYLKINPE